MKAYKCDVCGQHIAQRPPTSFAFQSNNRSHFIVTTVEDLCSKDLSRLLTQCAEQAPWLASPLATRVFVVQPSLPVATALSGDTERTLPEY